MFTENPPPIVRMAEASETQLIEIAQAALSSCNWTVGECASQWTQRYASGRTDADFGATLGLSGDQVCQRRLVWESFADVYKEYPNLKWSHFYAARTWEDSAECLQWANDLDANVAEMKAWRRSQHGEDLSETAEDEAQHPVACEGERQEGDRAPQRVKRNDSRKSRGGECRSEEETRESEHTAPSTVPAGKKRAQPPPDDPDGQRPDTEASNSPGKTADTDVRPDNGRTNPIQTSNRDLSRSEVIVRLRTLLRNAEKSLEPDDLSEIGDECRSWANKLAPVFDDSGKFKAPRNESERLAFVEQVRAYCIERNNRIDPEAFVDHYQRQGWKLANGNAMKDWKSAVRTWEHRQSEGSTAPRGTVANANARSDERRQQMERVSGRYGSDDDGGAA